MPLYDYECFNCEFVFEDFKPIETRENSGCPKCYGHAKQIMSATKLEIFKPFIHEDLSLDMKPVLVKSKEHYRRLCKENGVYAPYVFGQGYNISEI